MKLFELPHLDTTEKNNIVRRKEASFLSNGSLFAGGTLVTFLLVWALLSFYTASPIRPSTFSRSSFSDHTAPAESITGPDRYHHPPEQTFYNDPELKYTIDSPPVKDWVEKRREWLKQHPSFAASTENRILMVTGSQPTPCKNPTGDYLMLKLLKNKVDYCRRHGIDIFY